MWIVVTLIVIVAAATAASIGAWLALLLEATETPACPRCGGRTRKIEVKAANASERMVIYRCRKCGNDPTPPERTLRWAKSRLEPPR